MLWVVWLAVAYHLLYSNGGGGWLALYSLDLTLHAHPPYSHPTPWDQPLISFSTAISYTKYLCYYVCVLLPIQNNGKNGDNFMNQMEPIASKIPYMVAVGNHEFKEYVSSRNNAILMIHRTMPIHNF